VIAENSYIILLVAIDIGTNYALGQIRPIL